MVKVPRDRPLVALKDCSYQNVGTLAVSCGSLLLFVTVSLVVARDPAEIIDVNIKNVDHHIL